MDGDLDEGRQSKVMALGRVNVKGDAEGLSAVVRHGSRLYFVDDSSHLSDVLGKLNFDWDLGTFWFRL